MFVRRAFFGTALWTLTAAAAVAAPPTFSLPIACIVGRDCHVQNYADVVQGSGAGDFGCGGLTYDGHKGVDFRLRDAAAIERGISVLAGADGVVAGIRNDMEDSSIRDGGIVAGRECGNGVLLKHEGRWVSQYCHLQKGSVQVKVGDTVSRGAVLGKVGLSGHTEFAHLHFEVRHAERAVDPFTGRALGDGAEGSCGETAASLWDGAARSLLGYEPAAFLSGGFAAEAVNLRSLERLPPAPPTQASGALVAYVRVLGVRAGDVETMSIVGPDGSALGAKGPVALTAPKVQWLSFVGRKRGSSTPWPAGRYQAKYKLERDGRILVDEQMSLDFP